MKKIGDCRRAQFQETQRSPPHVPEVLRMNLLNAVDLSSSYLVSLFIVNAHRMLVPCCESIPPSKFRRAEDGNDGVALPLRCVDPLPCYDWMNHAKSLTTIEISGASTIVASSIKARGGLLLGSFPLCFPS